MASEEKKWRKLVTRKDADLPTFSGVALTAYKFLWPLTKTREEYIFWHFKGGHFTYYIQGVDEHWFGRALYKKYFNSPEKIMALYKSGQNFLKKTKAETRRWRRVIERKSSPGNLAQAFKIFKQSFDFVNDTFSIMPWWALETWQGDFESSFRGLIERRKLSGGYERILKTLLRPWQDTAVIKVGRDLKKGVAVERLVNKYQFLRGWTVVWYKPINKNWIRSAAGAGETGKKLISIKKLLSLLKPDKSEQWFIKMAPYVSFFKDWRDDLRRRHAFSWHFIFERIGKYFNLPWEDLGYFTLDEIALALKNNRLDKTRLEARKGKEFILTVAPGELSTRVIEGVPDYYRKAMVKALAVGGQAEPRGVVASPGMARGRAKIIRTYYDIIKVNKGDILISNTTHPDYLPAMKKAAAFVTDEGGIASHAAIVAREMKKPCLVGTKISTDIFKDGDYVEVDANRGVVKKIEKR